MQTVKDLIEELKKYPEDAKIMGVARHAKGGFWSPVAVEQALNFDALNALGLKDIAAVHIVLTQYKHDDSSEEK
jgi:hypothetical protein